MRIGTNELLIILVVALLIFGHEFDAENAKYPEMFSSVVENWLAVHGL